VILKLREPHRHRRRGASARVRARAAVSSAVVAVRGDRRVGQWRDVERESCWPSDRDRRRRWRCRVVLNLERERCIRRTECVRRRRELQVRDRGRDIVSPAVTGAAPSVSVPAVGNVVIFTADSVCAGVSFRTDRLTEVWPPAKVWLASSSSAMARRARRSVVHCRDVEGDSRSAPDRDPMPPPSSCTGT